MENQPIFKTTTFGGFDKKAVLDYIYQLNESAEMSLGQLQEQVSAANRGREEMEAALKRSQEQAEALRRERDSLQAELAGERGRTGELDKMVEDLHEEVARQRAQLSAKEAEMETLTRTNGEFAGRIAELESKRQEVEQASTQIGKLLIDAHTEADGIVTEAQRRTESLLEQSKSQAESILAQAEQGAQQRLQQIEEEASQQVAKARFAVDTASGQFSVFRSEIAGIQRSIMDALDAMSTRTTLLNESIDSAEAILSQSSLSIGTGEDFSPAALPEQDYEGFPTNPHGAIQVEDDAPSGERDFFRSAAEQ